MSIPEQRAAEAAEAEGAAPQRVTIADIDVSIWSLTVLQLKLIVAAWPIAVVVAIIYAIHLAW